MLATLPYLETSPPRPIVFTMPISSKLFRLYQSPVKLIRLSRKPSSTPRFSSCFFSKVRSGFAREEMFRAVSLSAVPGRQWLAARMTTAEFVTQDGPLSAVRE